MSKIRDWKESNVEEGLKQLANEEIFIRQEVAFALCDHGEGSLGLNFAPFGFHEMPVAIRKELIWKMAGNQIDSFNLIRNFYCFQIEEMDFIARIGHVVAEKKPGHLYLYIQNIENPRHSFGDEAPVPPGFKRQTVPTSLKWEWYGIARRAEFSEKIQDFDKFKKTWKFYSTEDLGNHKINFFSSESDAPIHPFFKALYANIQKETKTRIREDLTLWLSFSACQLLNKPLDKTQEAQINGHVKAILNLRSEELRYAATQLLAQGLQNPQTTKEFVELLQQCKTYTKLFAGCFFSLIPNVQPEFIQQLLGMLHHKDNRDKIKSSKNQLRMMSALTALAQQEVQKTIAWFDEDEDEDYLYVQKELAFPSSLKHQLFQACWPAGQDEGTVKRFVTALQQLECFLIMVNSPSKFAYDCYQQLLRCDTPKNLDENFEAIVGRLFAGIPDLQDQNFLKRFNDYNTTSRYPNWSVIYAAKLHCLDEPDKSQLLKVFGQFLAPFLSGDTEALEKLYTEPAASEHTKYLHNHFPEKMKLWHQPVSLDIAAGDLNATVEETDIRHYLHDRLISWGHAGENAFPFVREMLENRLTAAEALQQAEQANASESEKALLHLLRVTDKNRSVKEKMTYLEQSMRGMSDGEFLQDLRTLHKNLERAGQRKDVSHYRFREAKDFETRALANTDAPNCQRIDGHVSFNKGLCNEMSNGTESFLVVQDDLNKKIDAHRTLRVLAPYDIKKKQPITAEQPVLFLETGYDNGVPASVKHALIELARKKAREMDCLLLTKDPTIETVGIYPHAVASLGSPAPWAYIDAAGGLQKDGKYVMSDVKIINTKEAE